MAEQDRHRTSRALFSIDATEWKAFQDATGTNRRAEVLRAFIAWYLRRPGAKLPQRPPEP